MIVLAWVFLHSDSELGLVDAMVRATDRFRPRQQVRQAQNSA